MSSSSATEITPTNNPPLPLHLIVALSAGSQLYIKLEGDNYQAWRIQFLALLTGYDLLGYIDRSTPCPSKQLENNATAVNPVFIH